MKTANHERQLKFSIRKLTVGACSVVISTLFLSLSVAHTVNADSTPESQTTELQLNTEQNFQSGQGSSSNEQHNVSEIKPHPDQSAVDSDELEQAVSFKQKIEKVEPTRGMSEGKKGSETGTSKIVTRTINVTNPITGEIRTIRQEAHVNESWAHYSPPTIRGYTPNINLVPYVMVKRDQKDETINITYQEHRVTVKVLYQDDKGNTIKTDEVSGLCDHSERFDLKVSLPTGWDYEDTNSIPVWVDFRENMPDMVIKIKHGVSEILPSQPLKEGSKTWTGVPIIGGRQNDLNTPKVTRRIYYIRPDFHGNWLVDQQESWVFRYGYVDQVTGNVSYGPWINGHWDELRPLPYINYKGERYIPDISFVPRKEVTLDTKSENVLIRYRLEKYLYIKYKDIDTGRTLRTDTFPGAYDSNIDIYYQAPDNYVIVNENHLPKKHRFGKTNETITVLVSKKKHEYELEPGKPITGHDLALLIIQYKEYPSKRVLDEQTIEGTVGHQANIEYKIPSGYQLVGSLPNSEYIFTGHDKPIVIWVKKDSPNNPGEDPKGPEDKPTGPKDEPEKDPDKPGNNDQPHDQPGNKVDNKPKDDNNIDLPKDPEIDDDGNQDNSSDSFKNEIHNHSNVAIQNRHAKTNFSPSQDSLVITNTESGNQLPQTGEQNEKESLIAAIFASLAAGLVFFKKDSKKRRF